MWYRTEIKSRARAAFQRNYWNAVAVAAIFYFIDAFRIEEKFEDFWQTESVTEFIYWIRGYWIYDFWGLFMDILLASALLALALLIGVFVKNVIEVGADRFFMENRRDYASLKRIGYGFVSGHYMNIVWIQFLRGLFIGLWTLLFIVPGIIKSYEYRMIPYLLAENPNMSRERAFQLSRQMMMGQKMEVFFLDLSFIGWWIASMFTCGIAGWFFVKPYKQAAMAELYAVLRMDALQRGYVTSGELSGFEG